MKIECIKEKLKDSVYLAEKITGKNLTLPVLSNILLIVKNKTLIIRATNLDLGIEIKIPVKVYKDGIISIPGSVLNNLLSNISDNSILLESQNENLSIKTKNSSTVIKSYPYEDFPTLPVISKDELFTISPKKYIEGLRSVWYSASFSDIKPEIASVYIYNDLGNIIFVATDSFRLSEKKIQINLKERISPVLIPFKNISDLIRIFESVQDDITVIFNKNQISFESEGIYIISRLIDGVFPDYKQILPKEYISEAILLKQDIMQALKMTNLFSDKLNQINISVDKNEKTFKINSKNFDIGENTIKIDAAISGESVDLNFNYKYIFDCFQSITKDSISFQFSGENKPLVIQGVGDRSFTYLVMPLNQ